MIRPNEKIKGVKYQMSVTPTGIELQWFSSDREAWTKVLTFIRALPRRTYDSDVKKWVVPNTQEYLDYLRSSGWQESEVKSVKEEKPKKENPTLTSLPTKYKEYALAPEVVPSVDPLEVQRNLVSNLQLNPDKELIPGLREYQIDFLKFADHRKGRVMLLDGMGTGKTLQSLSWLCYNRSFPALIVVNAPTKLQWKAEFKRWLGKVPGCPTRVQVCKGKKPRKLESGISAIINWDILHDWLPTLVKQGYRCLIGDEAQAIGNPTSKRSRAFKKLSKVIPEVIVMSGTPARSRPLQFYSMMDCVDDNMFPDFTSFKYRYCDPKWTPFGVKFDGATNSRELHSKIVQIGIRREKKDVMKFLPPRTIEAVPLEVDELAVKKYLEEESACEFLSGNDLRLQIAKMAASTFLMKEKSVMEWIDDFLEKSGGKLLLFAWHRNVVDILHESLSKYSPAKIYGGISLELRDSEKKRFINDPSCRILIGNIQAAGVGIDGLQDVCHDVAFAEFSFTPTDMDQAIDRLHRGGQDQPVTAYYLIAPGTVDEDTVEVLNERSKMLEGVLDGKDASEVDVVSLIAMRRGLKI